MGEVISHKCRSMSMSSEFIGKKNMLITKHLLLHSLQRVPALHGFRDFEKTSLCEICASGTVGGSY